MPIDREYLKQNLLTVHHERIGEMTILRPLGDLIISNGVPIRKLPDDYSRLIRPRA